jgi:hypothetical protein
MKIENCKLQIAPIESGSRQTNAMFVRVNLKFALCIFQFSMPFLNAAATAPGTDLHSMRFPLALAVR